MSISASSRRIARPVSRTGFLFAFALLLSFAFAAPGWASDPAPEKPQFATASWDVLDAVATIDLDTATLSALGFDVTELQPSVSGHAPHPLSVARQGAPSFGFDRRISLSAAVGADGFHTFAGGSLHSRGGFRLHGRGQVGDIDLSSFELRPGAKDGAIEVLDTQGVPMLAIEGAQWELDAKSGRLRYLNSDLRILPEMARRLGEERYVGTSVGIFALDLTLAVGPVPAAPQPPEGIDAPPPCGDWSGTVDVALTNMANVGQAGIATVNGRSVVVVLPSANLQNVGTANVPWFSKFTNLGVPPWNDQHPFLVWQMLRQSNGVLEPIGKSDLKHAFLTLNSGCAAGACTDSHVLGIGCSDLYDSGTNNSVTSLAPRSEVTASTGIWAHCGGIPSHFDTNGDCTQDFNGSGENSFTHGLKAAETDLQVAGASYYVEAFYIIRNDSNIFNSMGYRQVAPAKPASVWTFPTAGPYTQGPAINAWVNPASPGVNADNRTIDTGEGHVQLAVRVSDVSGSPGRKRFAYALQNHDFDRRIKSFHIPFNLGGATVTNIAYADGDGFAANDWTSTVDATGITWTAPAATMPPAELDYATLISFRFEIDAGVAAAQSALGVFEAGSPTQLQIQTLAPAVAAPAHPGSFFAVTPCRLIDTRGAIGPNGGPALSPNQERVIPAVGQCGIPATAKALALNLTVITPDSAGFAVVYPSGTPPSISSINYTTGQVRANNMVAGVGGDGNVRITAVQPIGVVHAVLDVNGYFE